MSQISDQEQQLRDLAAYGSPRVIDTTGYASGSPVSELATCVGYVREVLTQFRKAVAQVNASRNLTAEGKAQQLGEIGPQYLAMVDNFNRYLSQGQAQLDKLRTGTSVAASASDPSASAIFASEIRGKLPNDQLLVRDIYMNAINQGETAVYDAIRLAPRFMNFLPAADVAEGEQLWEAKRDPAKAKLVADLRNAINTLTQLMADTRAAIRSEAGIKGTSPVEAMAKGGA